MVGLLALGPETKRNVKIVISDVEETMRDKKPYIQISDRRIGEDCVCHDRNGY